LPPEDEILAALARVSNDTEKNGEKHPETIRSMANLATTYYEYDRWKEAEDIEVKVIALRTEVLGERHPETILGMANLGETYNQEGRMKETEDLKLKTLALRREVLGYRHPDTIESMATLATTYSQEGRLKEAEGILVEALALQKEVVGVRDPLTIHIMKNLALIYHRQGRFGKGEELDLQTIKTLKRLVVRGHLDTLTCIANLALKYKSQGRWKETEELEAEVVEVRSQMQGEEHPDTLASVANLALTYGKQGQWKDAEELEVQILKTKKRLLGTEHLDTLDSMVNLASTLWSQDRCMEAEELEAQVMEIRKKVLGVEHPDTLASITQIIRLRSPSKLQEFSLAPTMNTFFPSASTTSQSKSSDTCQLTPGPISQSMQTMYQPLNERRSEIRLLEFLSDDGDEMVQCRLSTSSLEDNPEFTALSYVWGSPKITENVILNNELFPATVNLATALKYVKAHWCKNFPDRDPRLLRLWVDAICIDQKDPNERGSQVDLMRDIYSKAELVLSWLGHEIDEMDIALDALKTIAKEIRELGMEGAGVEWLKSYPTWWNDSAEFWEPIQTFFRLPYWSRIWIFQEFVLGKHILFMHGSTGLEYEDLRRAASWLFFTDISIRNGEIEKPKFLGQDIWISLQFLFHTLPILTIRTCKEQMLKDNPWSIFHLSSSLRATDPRDHFYGLLGLQDFNIVPDYRKDLNSVSHDLVNAWITDSNRLDCLLYAGVGTFDRGPYGSLASWAPNFLFKSQKVQSGSPWFATGHAYHGVFFNSIIPPTLIDSVLHVSALVGPVVVKVHEIFPLSIRSEQLYEFAVDFVRRTPCDVNGIHPLKVIFELFRNLVSGYSAMNTPFVSEERLVRLAICFFRILLAPAEAIKISREERSALLGVPLDDSCPESFFSLFFPGLNFEKNEFLEKLWSQDSLHTDMTAVIKGETEESQVYFRFTEMAGGYLGLAPRFSRPDDVVAILHGCKVPVILRKHGDHYILIGTSNIPRLMEGEGKELYEVGAARFEEIQIR
jgi:tetratricopeptide (TPR) repeat protein